MINNRQGGRRRGRGGGGRPPGSNSGPGNRQDNRQRGNAAQLLEKYKGLARDTQMQGDRVQSEYFLQYADHYYRVLNESRARYEEQRRQRDDDSGDEDEDREEAAAAGSGEDRVDRDDRDDRDDRARGNGRYRGRRELRRDEGSDGDEGGDERIAADSLPPAIAGSGGEDEEAEPGAKRPAVRAVPAIPTGSSPPDLRD